MSDQPHYPYADGGRAVLGPDVTASADGMTICWQGAKYRRDHGEIQRYADRLAALAREILDAYDASGALRNDKYQQWQAALDQQQEQP